MAPLQIGTATAERGRRTTGQLTLGYAPDGPVTTDVHIATGEHDGPVLWLQALVHGQEVGGALAIGRFFRELDLGALKGSVVAVPIANPLAFRAQSRNLPVDGINLNRVFPGLAGGSHTQQLADTLLTTALAHADAIVDLHSGGDRSHVPFYALHWFDDSPASRESGRLARAAGTADIWEADDDWLDGAMFTHAVKRGTPAVIIEYGGGAHVPESHLDTLVTSLRGVAQAAGNLPGSPPAHAHYRRIGTSTLVHNRFGGLFVASCGPGDVVQEGQEIGRIIDVMGEVLERIVAPSGPSYIAAIRRTHHAVHSGEMICEANLVKEDGSAGARRHAAGGSAT